MEQQKLLDRRNNLESMISAFDAQSKNLRIVMEILKQQIDGIEEIKRGFLNALEGTVAELRALDDNKPALEKWEELVVGTPQPDELFPSPVVEPHVEQNFDAIVRDQQAFAEALRKTQEQKRAEDAARASALLKSSEQPTLSYPSEVAVRAPDVEPTIGFTAMPVEENPEREVLRGQELEAKRVRAEEIRLDKLATQDTMGYIMELLLSKISGTIIPNGTGKAAPGKTYKQYSNSLRGVPLGTLRDWPTGFYRDANTGNHEVLIKTGNTLYIILDSNYVTGEFRLRVERQNDGTVPYRNEQEIDSLKAILADMEASATEYIGR